MTYADVFGRLGKLLSVYDDLSAVFLHTEDNVCSVRGVGARSAFGFSIELSSSPDLSYVGEPDKLRQACSLVVSDVCVRDDAALEITGSLNSGEDAPALRITCAPAHESLAWQATALNDRVTQILSAVCGTQKVCDVTDNLTPWLSLAQCGRSLFLTGEMAYSLGASASAFYACDGAYQNTGDEPLQLHGSYPAQLSTMQAVCGADLFLLRTSNGAIFVAVSADNSVFALSAGCAPQKHMLQRVTRFYSDAIKFSSVVLPQSVVRDTLSASDKWMVEIESGETGVGFLSGARGLITIPEIVSLDCACVVTREHAVLALGALPDDEDLTIGYGWSGGGAFLTLSAQGVIIMIPAQDNVEVA